MTREEAINEIKSWDFLNEKESEAVRTLIPELRESEDERIRKKLYNTVMGTPNDSTWFDGTSKEAMLAWLEKQKEQKPAEKQDYSGLTDLERAIHRGFLCAGIENVPTTIIKETAKECLKLIDNYRPVEWSEEDEHRRQQAINALDRNGYYLLVDWLKSLRPSWKPSEEQIEALENSTALTEEQGAALYSLIQDLKKL